ncbi:hypothetical protein SeMB42_g05419 [Synchytrium endobioticum]|uniref:Ubiquitin-like domain-containing protein n=1 Tax=Synchytrium endobioticum TaxID=286115 RepID=A0A507CNU6_9FUNG|nr:hypothetical protein SeLEV6574_g06409 [Synchytrium endobioticum]TPX41778.1 hypothetical protein SeMB42_g05419 [Synchytrium endobioticum]
MPPKQHQVVIDSASELAFATHFLQTLGSRPVKYPCTYQPPADADIPPLPAASRPFVIKKIRGSSSPASSSADITIQIKELKSNTTHSVTMPKTSTIMALKSTLAPLAAIPVTSQRLVHRGKALLDTKTLLDYAIGNRDTIHLLKKVGTDDPTPLGGGDAANKDIGSVETNPLTRAGIDTGFWNGLSKYLKTKFEGEGGDSSTNSSAGIVYDAFVKAYAGLVSGDQVDKLHKAAKQ